MLSDQSMMYPPGNNIALSYAIGVSIHRLAVFVLSWAAHSPDTELVIFTAPQLLQHRRVIELYTLAGVKGVPFLAPPKVDDPRDTPKPGRIPMAALQHYLLYLEQNPGDMTKAIAVLGPVQDIVIQGDPFTNSAVQEAISDGVMLFSQSGGSQIPSIRIRQHVPTTQAVHECYGSPGIISLRDKELLTVDAVFGRRDAAMQYVRLMSDILETRVRFKCLTKERPDVAALAHVVYNLGADPLNLDFQFRVITPEEIDSPVLEVSMGLPAILDARGRVHRGPIPPQPFIALVKDPVPPVVTKYEAHPTLLQVLLNQYRTAPIDLVFVQSSGYRGSKMALKGPKGDALPDDEALPLSWAEAAKTEVGEAEMAGITADFDKIVEKMVKKRTATAKKWRKDGGDVEFIAEATTAGGLIGGTAGGSPPLGKAGAAAVDTASGALVGDENDFVDGEEMDVEVSRMALDEDGDNEETIT